VHKLNYNYNPPKYWHFHHLIMTIIQFLSLSFIAATHTYNAADIVTAVKKWKMEVDEALGKLGKIGRWQIVHYTMISIACFALPCFHGICIIYVGKCTRFTLLRSEEE